MFICLHESQKAPGDVVSLFATAIRRHYGFLGARASLGLQSSYGRGRLFYIITDLEILWATVPLWVPNPVAETAQSREKAPQGTRLNNIWATLRASATETRRSDDVVWMLQGLKSCRSWSYTTSYGSFSSKPAKLVHSSRNSVPLCCAGLRAQNVQTGQSGGSLQSLQYATTVICLTRYPLLV